MLTSKIGAIILLVFSFLGDKSVARVRHLDEFTGKSKSEECDCGIPFFKSSRVIGNDTQVTYWHQYPWMVALWVGFERKIICGGSIIDTQYVLTAAHCLERLILYDKVPTSIKALMLKPEVEIILSLHRVGEAMVTMGIAAYFIHPTYDENNSRPFNDIAIIRLEKPIFYSKRLKPICLAVDPKMTRVGTKVRVTGFGYTSNNKTMADVLQEIEVPIQKNSVCKKNLKTDVLETAICAGGRKNEDACQGDSGGPMFYTDSDDRSYQVGIISWGEGCGRQGKPAIYTRINSFLHWIRNITADSPSCEMMFPPLVVANIADCGIPEERCTNSPPPCTSGDFMYSWMAKIFYEDKYLGTGVLVNRSYVLTSVKVLPPWRHFNRTHLHVILGMRREVKNNLDASQLKTGIASIIYHPLLRQVTAVIAKLDIATKDITILHRPLCVPERRTRRRVGERVNLMFWKEEKPMPMRRKCKRKKCSRRCRRKKKTGKKNRMKFKQYRHSQEEPYEVWNRWKLAHTVVKIVEEKRCKVPKAMKGRVMCGIMVDKHQKCHENGAVLMNYVAGRFYMLGIVAPETKKCSRTKLFQDISWNVEWIVKTMTNLRVKVTEE